jgi:acyl-CoA reductase-like NAD-dependent aldehyde dehydrogenase
MIPIASLPVSNKRLKGKAAFGKPKGGEVQMQAAIVEEAAEYLTQDHNMLIGGQWVPAASGETFDVEDPATENQIAKVPSAAPEDVDRAVKAAREAFESRVWRGMNGTERARIMWRLSDLLLEHRDKLEDIETLDNGMPRSFARYVSDIAANSFRYYAGFADKIYGRSHDLDSGGSEFHNYTRYEPYGVVASITPWNGPLGVACATSAAAIAAGCSVILKPAEQAPLTTLLLGELILKAGVPPGVVNIVTGFGATAGAALVEHPDVDKICFTGSTVVGKGIIRATADSMKRVKLELGGKSPVFIFEDADLDMAIPRAAMGIFANSGQICYAGSRLYVQRRVYDKVVAEIVGFAKNLKVGSGFDPASQLGPLISRKQYDRVSDYIQIGVDEGAEIVAGGNRLPGRGYFLEPTVFTGGNAKMRIVQEEIFGPVLSIMPFDDLESVAALANSTDYGLGAGIYTSNVSTAHKAAKAIRAGRVWVNCFGESDRGMPFGGFKQSGWGRGGGPEGFMSYFETQAVTIKL